MTVRVAVTVDTEEDDWGSYATEGARVENIRHLPALHEMMVTRGARVTYFVNRPPLVDKESVAVLSELARDDSAEIGTHCHPWNSPPIGAATGPAASMMCAMSQEVNREKIAGITQLIQDGLGVSPSSFRTGRWGFGRSVAGALADLGYQMDSSVSPFVSWARDGGPDYTNATLTPYRFDPDDPLTPRRDGAIVELPVSIGGLRGHPVRSARARARIEASLIAGTGVVGVLDRVGVFARRWLSPETSSAEEMVRLADNLVEHGLTFLNMTFHSCTLLPGATPFVRSEGDAVAFVHRIRSFLDHCVARGWCFETISGVGESVGRGW